MQHFAHSQLLLFLELDKQLYIEERASYISLHSSSWSSERSAAERLGMFLFESLDIFIINLQFYVLVNFAFDLELKL